MNLVSVTVALTVRMEIDTVISLLVHFYVILQSENLDNSKCVSYMEVKREILLVIKASESAHAVATSSTNGADRNRKLEYPIEPE